MAYTVNNTQGSVVATVADGTIDTSTTSITFIGKNYAGYGEIQNENFLKLMENFANPTQPSTPQAGQCWWDTSTTLLKVWSGSQWKNVGSATASATAPSGPNQGDLWYDTTNKQLKAYNSTSTNWDLIGPDYTAAQQLSGQAIQTISDGVSDHVVVYIYVASVLLAIWSKDATFTPSPSITGFSVINPGINFNSSISGIRFAGTASNSDLLDNLDSTQFLRSDVSDSTDGQLTINNNSGLIVGTSNDFTVTVSGTSSIIGTTTGNLNLTPVAGASTVISSNLLATASTASTSSATGAVRVTGGVGIGGNLFVGSAATIGGNLTLTGGTINSTGGVSISGNLSAGNISTTGELAANITSTGTSSFATANVSTLANITSTTASTSTTTGALQVAGGVGIVGNVNAGNVSATNVTGTLTTAAQPNVTSLGTLTGLTVNGVTTISGANLIVNSTQVDFTDINLTVAKGATAAGASGGGLTVDGAGATLTYDNSDATWNLNIITKFASGIKVLGSVASTGYTTGAAVITGGLGVSGNVYTNGNIFSNGDVVAYASSDARLKTNVKNITNALEKISKINGVTFDWITPTPDRNRTEAGLIAQEIQAVLPEVVTTREDGMLAVKYDRVISLLIEAIKELKAEVDQLKGQ
jgi:hypothetical protein